MVLVELAEAVFSKYTELVQVALNGSSFSLAILTNERQQTAAFGEWQQQKLTKASRKVSLQPLRYEQGCGVLWGYLRRANVTRTKPRKHFGRKSY